MNNDSFKKLADVIKENNLRDQALDYLANIQWELLADIIKENNGQALDYLAEIKNTLEEKEKLEQALDLACEELEDLDSSLYDLYDSLDYYYETKDRYEWKEYLLESVKDDE